ncbi:hypothetical protein BH24ACI3_BH24ACI3_07400 [soil metagenome]
MDNEVTDSSYTPSLRPHTGVRRSVRVSPGSYLSVIFVLAFFSSLSLYLEYDIAGFLLLFFSFVIVPILAFSDRIVFDGRALRRTGIIPRLWTRAKGMRQRLKVRDVEQVDSQSLRGIRRNGKVSYRYRTTFRGKGIQYSVISGGARYRRFIRSILPRLDIDVLDARSIELREHLNDPAAVFERAKASAIPAPEVLENSIMAVRVRKKHDDRVSAKAAENLDPAKANALRALANELRVSGALLQALEAFRRALLFAPRDGWLLFEFGRCMQAFAGTERDDRLHRRGVALMRLAEQRAGTDPELLTRLGETYVQVGDWKRASSVFKRAADTFSDNFRAVRGLAEVALREGKIAHVIHNFAAANRNAGNTALRRWTKGEMEYFSRLHEDDEYMELEISRVNLLDSLVRARGFALAVAMVGMPLILAGLLLEIPLVTNVGWASAGVAIVSWSLLSVMQRMLADRIPFDLLERQ